MRLYIFFIIFFFQTYIYSSSYPNTLWTHSSGGVTSNRYSDLSTIDENNIANLSVAWTFNTGAIEDDNNSQVTPIFTGKYLITASLDGMIYCLDPYNGKIIWKKKLPKPVARRGLTYFDNNIFIPTSKGVFVINERNGEVNNKLGKKGSYGNELSLLAPIVHENNVYVATLNKGVYAYDFFSGEKKWNVSFDKNKIAPSDGNIRVWSGFSFDPQTNTLFVSTSNPGGVVGNDRSYNLNENKDYSSSIVAIDAKSGKVIWSFQDTENDLWDYDVVGAPVITDIKLGNKKIRSVIVGSKTGNILILNVINGQPIFKNSFYYIQTPTSDVEGVKTSKYQKIFTKPKKISKTFFTEDDLNIENKIDEEYFNFKLRNTKFGHYLPPSLNYDIVLFGLHGGPSWTGASLSNDRRTLIFTTNESPWFIRLYYRDRVFTRLSNIVNKIKFFLYPESINSEIPRWSDGQYSSDFVDKIYSKIPVLGKNEVFIKKCASCHGIAGQGLIQSESDGDKYYPPLTGITLTDKKKYIIDFQKLNYVHKYENNFKISKEEYLSLNKFFKERDSFLNKYDLLRLSGKWQLFLKQNKLPASNPPYGKLVAIDIFNGKKLWEKPFGSEVIEGKKVSGLQNHGGLLSLGSGIFFATGTTDEKIRSFRSVDGEEIWSDKLPAAGSAPPMTYYFKKCQYILVNASGGRFFGFRSKSDSLVSYKLKNCKNK